MRPPDRQDLVGLPFLPHHAQETLPALRRADGTDMEPVPVLRHTGEGYLQNRTRRKDLDRVLMRYAHILLLDR